MAATKLNHFDSRWKKCASESLNETKRCQSTYRDVSWISKTWRVPRLEAHKRLLTFPDRKMSTDSWHIHHSSRFISSFPTRRHIAFLDYRCFTFSHAIFRHFYFAFWIIKCYENKNGAYRCIIARLCFNVSLLYQIVLWWQVEKYYSIILCVIKTENTLQWNISFSLSEFWASPPIIQCYTGIQIQDQIFSQSTILL